MWSHMWSLHLSVGEKVLRAVVIYLFLVLALRLAGKRELAQLNTLDFVVLLAVANAVQNGLIGNDNSVTGALARRHRAVRDRRRVGVRALPGGPAAQARGGYATVLIKDAVLQSDALRKQEMSTDDLLVEVQVAGVSTFDESRPRRWSRAARWW